MDAFRQLSHQQDSHKQEQETLTIQLNAVQSQSQYKKNIVTQAWRNLNLDDCIAMSWLWVFLVFVCDSIADDNLIVEKRSKLSGLQNHYFEFFQRLDFNLELFLTETNVVVWDKEGAFQCHLYRKYKVSSFH